MKIAVLLFLFSFNLFSMRVTLVYRSTDSSALIPLKDSLRTHYDSSIEYRLKKQEPGSKRALLFCNNRVFEVDTFTYKSITKILNKCVTESTVTAEYSNFPVTVIILLPILFLPWFLFNRKKRGTISVKERIEK